MFVLKRKLDVAIATQRYLAEAFKKSEEDNDSLAEALAESETRLSGVKTTLALSRSSSRFWRKKHDALSAEQDILLSELASAKASYDALSDHDVGQRKVLERWILQANEALRVANELLAVRDALQATLEEKDQAIAAKDVTIERLESTVKRLRAEGNARRRDKNGRFVKQTR